MISRLANFDRKEYEAAARAKESKWSPNLMRVCEGTACDILSVQYQLFPDDLRLGRSAVGGGRHLVTTEKPK
jgi:hypothetical protein